jgi:hypothetical protein
MHCQVTFVCATVHKPPSLDCISYPENIPYGSTLRRAQRGSKNCGSFAWFPLSEALESMNLERLQEIEMIDPTRLPPWRQEAFSLIKFQPGSEIAVGKAEAVRSTSDIV